MRRKLGLHKKITVFSINIQLINIYHMKPHNIVDLRACRQF